MSANSNTLCARNTCDFYAMWNISTGCNRCRRIMIAREQCGFWSVRFDSHWWNARFECAPWWRLVIFAIPTITQTQTIRLCCVTIEYGGFTLRINWQLIGFGRGEYIAWIYLRIFTCTIILNCTNIFARHHLHAHNYKCAQTYTGYLFACIYLHV